MFSLLRLLALVQKEPEMRNARAKNVLNTPKYHMKTSFRVDWKVDEFSTYGWSGHQMGIAILTWVNQKECLLDVEYTTSPWGDG